MIHVPLPEVDALEEPFPSLLHFYQARLQPLPELVVSGTADVTAVPDIVFDKLFYLVLPCGFQHCFFDRLNRQH